MTFHSSTDITYMPSDIGVGVHGTVVEWATHMRMYAGSSPTNIDHREELI